MVPCRPQFTASTYCSPDALSHLERRRFAQLLHLEQLVKAVQFCLCILSGKSVLRNFARIFQTVNEFCSLSVEAST